MAGKYLIKRIDVDMYGGSRWYMSTAMQGDFASRYISVRLLNEGEEVKITSDTDINVSVKKPSGKPIYNACALDEDGRIVFELKRSMLTDPGTLQCQIELTAKDMSWTARSAVFEIEVEKSVRVDEDIESSEEFTALEKKIKEANDLIEMFRFRSRD